MARALWSGSLSFGLVNVPVQLLSAVRDLDYHFRELHAKDRVPIEQRRFCSREGVEVSWEDMDEVDPIYVDHSYYLVPAGDSEGTLRAYRLLVDTMASQDRVALGRFVVRTKEYLVAVRAREGALALTTMLFHDEVRPTKDIPTGGKKPSPKQLDGAVAIIQELATDWDPEHYRDCYRERLKRVIDAKRKRKTIEVPTVEKEPPPVPDLMDALERTLERLRSGQDPRGEGPEDRSGNGAGSPGRHARR